MKPELVADACFQEARQAAKQGTKQGTETAISTAHRALQAALTAGQPQLQGLALMSIAQGYRTLMRFDSVLFYASRAAALGRESQNRELQAAAIATLSMAYSMLGRADSAFRLANDLMSVCPSPCPLGIHVTTLLSRYYPDSTRRSLLGFMEKATRGGDKFIRARVLDELGFYYSEVRNQYDTALAYHRAVDSLNAIDEWSIYGMGRAFRGLKLVDSAETYFRLQLAMARQSGARWSEAYALGNLGEMCHHDLPQPLLNCALAYYDSTTALAARMFTQVGSDENRTTVADFAAEIYEEFVFAALSYERYIGFEAAARAALGISEFGRSLGLLQYLASRDRSPGPRSPDGGQPTLPKRDSLEFLRSLDSTTYTLSYLLGKDTLLVWLTLPGLRVRVSRAAISRDSVIALVRAVREQLGVDDVFMGSRLRGTSLRTARASKQHRALSTRALRTASDLLIPADLMDLVPVGADLIVVPQYALSTLPFAVLTTTTGTELGLRNPIRYAPSLKVLESLRRISAKRKPLRDDLKSALVVSDPQMPDVDLGAFLGGEPEGQHPLSDLPSSLSEGQWIAKRFGTRNLTRRDATETRIRTAIRRANIIHFATHAVAAEYNNYGGTSFLATAADSVNDGLFTAGELLESPELSISAGLVVLSACQTAVGPLRIVEGTIGLQRAFLARGAETVLASLWSVNDESTALLMERFYTHLLDDPDHPSKAEALRRAQRDVRSAPGFNDPVYWAGFQVIGLN